MISGMDLLLLYRETSRPREACRAASPLIE
jgi:hypothetical protein